MSKPLPARTRSPGSNLFNSPQCSVMNLSDARPPQPFEIHDTVPWGVIPIRNFAVLWCLYEDHVWARASKHESLLIKTWKQSIMTAHEENFSLKQVDNVSFSSCLSGHFTRNAIDVNITYTQVWNTPGQRSAKMAGVHFLLPVNCEKFHQPTVLFSIFST